MKRLVWCWIVLTLILSFTVQTVIAQEKAGTGPTFPMRPLPASHPDFVLTNLNINYGKVVTEITPIYGSAEIASTGKAKLAKRTLPIGRRGLTYVSYEIEQLVSDHRFYQIAQGEWMSALDVKRISPSTFQGLVFRRTPDNDFGWVIESVLPQKTPGNNTGVVPIGVPTSVVPGAVTGKEIPPFQIVQIFAFKQVNGGEWYLIGPDQWVDGAKVARVMVNPVAPQGVTNGRWIEINLQEQTVSVYDQNRLVFATLVSSGVEPFWTKPGLFQIREKAEKQTMKLYDPTFVDNYLLEDVPWTMYFDQNRALHGAYWHNHYGAATSRGCVNLSVGDAQWLFKWAQVGEWVYVWDPSGKTPTDPAAYTEGGA